MKRHPFLLLATIGFLIFMGALAGPKNSSLLLLDWCAKAPGDPQPVAILIEMGRKDDQPTSWSGRAKVAGAKVVHREGYRFRKGDRLIDPDAWQMSSHRGLRVPSQNPAVARMEGIATIGVVLHLTSVEADATLAIEPETMDRSKVVVPLKDVLSGKSSELWGGTAVVRLISTATPVVTDKTEDDFPAACYSPDGTLWLAYISYHITEESRRIEASNLAQQPADFKAYYTPEFGDQLFVKSYRNGKWSEPIAVTGPKEDLVRCAIAAEGNGTVAVVYSANRSGKHDLYARMVSPKLGKEQNLTGQFARGAWSANLSPVMCTTRSGEVLLASQLWTREGYSGLSYMLGLSLKEDGWNARSSGHHAYSGATEWTIAVAAGPDHQWRIACDRLVQGDYDILLPYRGTRTTENGGGGPEMLAGSSRFEARPSICYDAASRLWIAYEEGPEKWGKDYGALDPDKGNPLYNARSVRVVCVEDGKLKRPVAELPTSRFDPPKIPFEPVKTQQFEKGTRYAYPQIGIDGKGRVWLTYRQKFGSRYTSHPGSYWLTFARRLDGDKWSEPIEVHHSDGLLDSRPVLLPHKSGGLVIVHNTDGRYTTPETIDNQIYMSYLDIPGDPVEPALVAHDPGKKDARTVEEAETEQVAVQRIRDYRIDVGGKKLQLLRGEFHRHTEISWDGGADGSLEDMFRYGIDAAGMDWIGNGDHDNGAGREYSWWLVQKFTDAYHIPNHFTPMFSYERSVSYPHGHRNCLFAKRGVRTLPRLADPDSKEPPGIHADDTKLLYRYLRELDGICAVHTSATSMGTDWRDNDSIVEPIVEIYQGDRMSYEIEGAPRAGYDPKSGTQLANIAGWFPKGFINHALQKGYRLGFQSSSDHWSTHISYFIVLAERHDRAAILDAIKRRHVYGATDDIILDVRSGNHLMGDEFKTREVPKLQIRILGTHALARIDILKDSDVAHTIKTDKQEYVGTWTDPQPAQGVHYYYVRVEQGDGELAWASPIWIDYAK
jgi:hypothetical protein